MLTNSTALPSAPRFRLIITGYITLFWVSYVVTALQGSVIGYDISYRLLNWIGVACTALIFEYSRRLCSPPKDAYYFEVLVILPGASQLATDYLLAVRNASIISSSDHFVLDLYLKVLYWSQAGMLLLIVGLLRAAYRRPLNRPSIKPAGASDTKSEKVSDTSPEGAPDTKSESIPASTRESPQVVTPTPPLLGRGDGYVERVIRSILERAGKSERSASFSLNIMLALVLIGGMSSFGLWIMTHIDRINTLEAERNKILAIEGGISDLNSRVTNINDKELKERLDNIIKFIKDNYSPSPSYEATLNRLSQQSQTNLPDIAIRVTIAVLTIFLVQVFFSVYKYNRHLAIMLSAKAEALELVAPDETARKTLSLEAVNIVKEGLPGFGPAPRTPLEEAMRIAEKLKKSA